ncbi:hypothetical protein GCM10011611_59680 [Aliidongia dinghuensis]|uniref:DUF4863 family protein n=1 Tax=Aliidongia dinghuensis TaxID=1867774 RepID=A0A8J2YZA5_9PROT|nr:DUF4863 family protein [Aliidongia dinghuensis]GGF45294.1 hypothetical protein GCM10011611_59680 [Aliidongia dinghuensis]
MDHRAQLIERSIPFLREIKDMTPGAAMERWLNATYGADSALYRTLADLIKLGMTEGWAANEEIAGPNYRRSRILPPSPETFHFSVTAVYMNSKDARAFKEGPDDVLRGDYHGHPYGEVNLVVPLDAGAELKGLQGWQGAGWTAPDPGSRHFPEVRGGAVIALFYLPAGRISYDFEPPSPTVR